MGSAGSKTPRATSKEGRTAGAAFDSLELHVIKLTYKDLAGLSKGDRRGESIDKATFLQNFPVPGLVGDRLFHALDNKGLGRISFDDFVVGLAVCCRGTLEEKMRFIFGVYDIDGDGLISRDELMLMLNQVPRSLLSVGAAHSYTFEGARAAYMNGIEAGSGSGRHQHSLVTPRQSGSGKLFGPCFRTEDAVLPPAPPSLGRKRVTSIERVSRRRSTGMSGRSFAAAVLEEFTNESFAEQAIRDFGGNGDFLTLEQFELWAQQNPAIQALLQGAFPTDAHFSLATSPRARRASCESLLSESPRRSSIRRASSSGAAATAVAAVVGWSASRPSSRQGTPRSTLDGMSGAGAGGGLMTPAGPGRRFFPPSEGVARTPSRGHSRNTSYDNLLRSPIVGQGVLPEGPSVFRRSSNQSNPGRGVGTPSRGTATPNRGAATPVRLAATPGHGNRTPVRGSQARANGASRSEDSRSGDAAGSAAPTSGPAQVASSGDSGGPKSAGSVENGVDNKPAHTVWRWGEGADAIVNNERKSPEAKTRGRKSPPPESWDPCASKGNGDSQTEGDNLTPAVSGDRGRRKAFVPSPSPRRSAMAASPASRVHPSRRRNGQGSGNDGVAPAAASGGLAAASLGALEGDSGGKMSPLPPLGSTPGVSSVDGRELTGKARKLARVAQVASGAGVSTPMTCTDLLALSFTGDNVGSEPEGVIRASGETKPNMRNGGQRHSLRLTKSFSQVDAGMVRNSKLESPSPGGRLGMVAKVQGMMTPQYANGRRRATGTPASSRRTGERGIRGRRGLLRGSTGSISGVNESGGESDTADAAAGVSLGGTPARGRDFPLTAELKLGMPAPRIGRPLGVLNDVLNCNVASMGSPGVDLPSAVGAEAVVRDTLYNSHGIVALDGYLWKPGALRIVRRWMMLVDNSLYYFIRPGDRKPRGVISLPGCVAEAVSDEDVKAYKEATAASAAASAAVGGSGTGVGSGSAFGTPSGHSGGGISSSAARRESRKHRIPPGFYGIRLLRPNNHGKHASCRLLLAKTVEERDEWVAELRVASRVVPLDEHFELKALLRKGAFASVHKGVHKATGKDYAIKVIDKTSLSSHEKSLLRGEIGALKLVSHPNVVRLEAVHEDPRSISIVMTLCRGGDLWDKVRSQPSKCFNTTQARTVMRPLCEAVLYLHDLGILHRDIKPENILLVHDSARNDNLDGVILSDFGFSHQVSPKSRLACGKQLMGTPSYMAPESILHGMYGKEVDWFACGCVLYMMLMGRAPFGGATPSEIFRNTCNGRLGLGRSGASLWDRLPADARDLIVGLMQLDHNLRFTGEQAMKHSWLVGDDESSTSSTAERRNSRKQSREEVVVVTDRRARQSNRSARDGVNGSGSHSSVDGQQVATSFPHKPSGNGIAAARESQPHRRGTTR